MTALDSIRVFKEGDDSILKTERWLLYIGLTKEQNINLERLVSLEEKTNYYVLNYVERTLLLLEDLSINERCKRIVQETLKWCEVSKGGLPHKRSEWQKKGYNLFVHNISAAQIYLEESKQDNPHREIVYTLIKTHGLIGQYIRGEVSLSESKPLFDLIRRGIIEEEELKETVLALNYCIIAAVDKALYNNIRQAVEAAVMKIEVGDFSGEAVLKKRVKALRETSVKNGEDFEAAYASCTADPKVEEVLKKLFDSVQLWYVEAALYDFSFEEFVKIFLLAAVDLDLERIKYLSFEKLMAEIYYEREGKKRINIYKKRIIEKYLSSFTYEDILQRNRTSNIHVKHSLILNHDVKEIAFFTFTFSAAGNKLIEYCVEAENSDILYEKAVVLLFDLFELRKDKYDRFYEEESYLSTMNSSIDHKKVILNYIVGNTVLDIGPGGGALMDLIEESYPEKKVVGVDIAQNVIDALSKKKHLEHHSWNVMYGDALNLSPYVEKGAVDTIIFCSILHELFSYIEFGGSKFNHDTLTAALKSAFEVLSDGGRIIIRDGIMTEPEGQKRIIKFLSEEGMEFLTRYASDFKGRQIEYTIIGQNEVLMPINDAMEFLYTYTWGEKSYVHEVNEQFGYFTPSSYEKFILGILGENAKIVESKHYLQEGYNMALSQKIRLYDEDRKVVELPDSTCLIVIEKVKD